MLSTFKCARRHDYNLRTCKLHRSGDPSENISLHYTTHTNKNEVEYGKGFTSYFLYFFVLFFTLQKEKQAQGKFKLELYISYLL